MDDGCSDSRVEYIYVLNNIFKDNLNNIFNVYPYIYYESLDIKKFINILLENTDKCILYINSYRTLIN